MFKELRYLILIIAIFISACIETDIYLPAFTDMMQFFAISEEQIQGILTWNFIAICLAGPFYGPLSDAIGRKKPLLFALGIFFLGSLLTVYSNTFTLMLLGRILQGVGSGGCFVLGTAIIFDTFQGEKALLAINRINSIVPFLMAGAPLLGGYLNMAYGFRSNFIAIAFFVLISLLLTLFFLEEPLPVSKRSVFNVKEVAKQFKTVASSFPFWQTVFIVCLIFAGYLTFLSNISLFFVLELGVDKAALPYFQAALLGAWLIASLTFKKVIDCTCVQTTKKIGTTIFAAGGIIAFGSALIAPDNPYWITSGMVLYSIGANWVQGIYFPEGMELFPDMKGITASFLTSARLLITAGVVGFTSHFYDASIYPIAYTILGIVVVILANIWLYERNQYVITRSNYGVAVDRNSLLH